MHNKIDMLAFQINYKSRKLFNTNYSTYSCTSMVCHPLLAGLGIRREKKL